MSGTPVIRSTYLPWYFFIDIDSNNLWATPVIRSTYFPGYFFIDIENNKLRPPKVGGWGPETMKGSELVVPEKD